MDLQNLITNIPLWAYFLFALIVISFLIGGKSKHGRKIKSANKALKKIKDIDNPQQQFAYLRKVDPFVFEEMILTAIKEHGHNITRNKRYTGDGGIDGRAVIHGQKVFIQAKRYKKHIAAADVVSFSCLCSGHGSKGLFVHTGRTGKKAKSNGRSPHIDIVSGQRMLDLLTGKQFSAQWILE